MTSANSSFLHIVRSSIQAPAKKSLTLWAFALMEVTGNKKFQEKIENYFQVFSPVNGDFSASFNKSHKRRLSWSYRKALRFKDKLVSFLRLKALWLLAPTIYYAKISLD